MMASLAELTAELILWIGLAAAMVGVVVLFSLVATFAASPVAAHTLELSIVATPKTHQRIPGSV